ncbi:MAG: CvpA family protein [Patescibacteria group bacterium]
MSLFDLALIVVLAGFVWLGWKAGLIQGIGSILGIFLGAWLAGFWYEGLAGWLLPILGNNQNIANILAFIILFLIISKLIGVIFFIVDKAFRIVAVLPGLKLLNRLGGAILGMIEGILTIGLIMVFAEPFAAGTVFAAPIDNSQLVGIFMGAAGWLAPILPEAVDRFRDGVVNVG